MENINIKKYIKFFLICTFVGICMSACSSDDNEASVKGIDEDDQKMQLAISLNSPDLDTKALNTRSTGDYTKPDYSDDKKIYSLEVLIFKSAGTTEAGKLDGYKSKPRQRIDSDSLSSSSEEYLPIDEIKGVVLTAGKRDIYVVANAPDNFFAGVTTLAQFKAKCDSLQRQGLFAHIGAPRPPRPDESPIGGQKPSDLKTNLTMCGSVTNVQFSNLHTQHYLGYTSGLPSGVVAAQVLPGNGADGKTFYVDRLVARVAIKTIKFELPNTLTLDGASITKDNYTYQLDSVFMMNAKTTSVFSRMDDNSNKRPVNIEFAHGSKLGYDLLKGGLSNVFAASELRTTLSEAIYSRSYDITVNDYPLWFYAFENDQSTVYPTYLVIGVKYNFRKAGGELRTVKCYYPVIINENGQNTDHKFIKRNYQYSLNIIIKGLGYKSAVTELKSSSEGLTYPLPVDVETTVGRNLFPWTGNIYR